MDGLEITLWDVRILVFLGGVARLSLALWIVRFISSSLSSTRSLDLESPSSTTSNPLRVIVKWDLTPSPLPLASMEPNISAQDLSRSPRSAWLPTSRPSVRPHTRQSFSDWWCRRFISRQRCCCLILWRMMSSTRPSRNRSLFLEFWQRRCALVIMIFRCRQNAGIGEDLNTGDRRDTSDRRDSVFMRAPQLKLTRRINTGDNAYYLS
mmetsp:Transcript_12548/g.30643  ORF Transcript_12548/g.30643 Transcript_12548/m.30643 type:complete len:208 (-) Transcript_12548:42-665(-)